MNGMDESRRLLNMALKDLKALRAMTSVEQFEEEIFGFHAQQAVEKVLKSWLALLDCEYPRTHDLSLLLHILEEKGEKCAPYIDLLELNVFAVQFRYEAFETDDEPMNRPAIIHLVEKLIWNVEKLSQSP